MTAAAQRGPPLAPGEEAGARRTEPAAAGGCKRRPGSPRCPLVAHSGPHRGLCARPPGTAWALVPSSRATGINPGSRAQKLPTAARVSRERPGCWGRAGTRGPSQAARFLVLPPGGHRQQRYRRTSSTPGLQDGRLAPTTLDPRGPFRPGIVGGCSREAPALACTSQGAVSQLNHRGSFPANKSPAHRRRVPPTPRV